jgi:hypothetical protein
MHFRLIVTVFLALVDVAGVASLSMPSAQADRTDDNCD